MQYTITPSDIGMENPLCESYPIGISKHVRSHFISMFGANSTQQNF